MQAFKIFTFLSACIKNPCNNHVSVLAKKSHIHVFRYMHALFYLIIFVNMSIPVCGILGKIKVHRFLCVHLSYMFS